MPRTTPPRCSFNVVARRLNGSSRERRAQLTPLGQCAQPDLLAVAIAGFPEHPLQGLLKPPGPCAFQVRALHPVQRIELGGGHFEVVAHTPPQALEATRMWLDAWRTGSSRHSDSPAPRTAG